MSKLALMINKLVGFLIEAPELDSIIMSRDKFTCISIEKLHILATLVWLPRSHLYTLTLSLSHTPENQSVAVLLTTHRY